LTHLFIALKIQGLLGKAVEFLFQPVALGRIFHRLALVFATFALNGF
jgi:hypothetical protein